MKLLRSLFVLRAEADESTALTNGEDGFGLGISVPGTGPAIVPPPDPMTTNRCAPNASPDWT